jgi:membrane dipeptidase
MKLTFNFLKSSLLLVITLLIIHSCNLDPDQSVETKAQQISQKYIIVDSHIDLPSWLFEEFGDVSKLTNTGNFDYHKAKEGGLDAPFLAVYISPKYEGLIESKERTDHQLDLLDKLFNENTDKLARALTPEDVKQNFKDKKISIPIGLENGAPIMGKMENLKHFYERGIRYITVVHGKCNHICDSSYDSLRLWNGVSDFARELIPEMNKMGMIIDVSHTSEKAFYDIMEITKAPVAATHSNARHFTPGFERNLTDEMIKMIAEKGGVIQIAFGSGFITSKPNKYRNESRLAFDKFVEENGLDYNSPETDGFRKEYAKSNPYPYATIDELLDHFDHIVKIAGVDHVGFGSDFEGVGDSLPEGLKDVSGYPNLIAGLLDRGYSESDIEKIMGLNFLNFWQRVQDFAK